MENVTQTPAQAEAATLSGFIKKISKWAKGNAVIGGLTLAFVLGGAGFAWKNADPPLVKAQILEIKAVVTKHIEKEEDKDQHRDIDVEVLKTSVANTNSKVNDISNKLDAQQSLLIQILSQSKQINNNTR